MELTIWVKAKPGKFQELYQTLQAILPTIRKTKGCRDSRIYQDVEVGEVFFLSVRWQARKNFEHYVRSSSGGALIGAVDLLSDTTKVRFGPNGLWEGIDALKRIRKTIFYKSG